jgi:peptidoglycan hydrolase-like protein with peptidoglycan-binding domain
MTLRVLNSFFAAVAAVVAFSLAAFAADTAAVTTVKLAQEELHHLGFYSGLIDGDLSGDTQAALAQFQLSRNIPASGALDDATLAALRIERMREDTAVAASEEPSAAAGGTDAAAGAPAQPEAK